MTFNARILLRPMQMYFISWAKQGDVATGLAGYCEAGATMPLQLGWYRLRYPQKSC